MASRTVKDLLIIATFVSVLTFLIWLPHILALPNFWGLDFTQGFSTIYRNFDGIEYVIIAKSLYLPEAILNLPSPLPPHYFASHFPGYSLLINLFGPLTGFLKSMLFVSVLSTIAAAITFYYLVKDFKLTSHPLLLTLIFLVLPARWLIVHSVGSSEPTFILFTLLALYFFMKFEQFGKFPFILLSAIAGFLAQITRPPGILLFIALGLHILYKLYLKQKDVGLARALMRQLYYFPLLAIPSGLLLIFLWYGQTYGDFWAYFHSGDNIHLTFPPYQVFNKFQYWVGDIWLEDVIYIFILGFLGALTLLKRGLLPFSFFVFTYLTASTLVAHRDISRYLLPISPLVLIAFEGVLTSKEFRIVLVITFLAIYLYAQNYILANTAPIPNLEFYN